MRNNIFNWMKLSSFIFALSILFVSCNQDEMFEPDAQETIALRVMVGDFPAFGGNAQTRASNIGVPDAGKTHWVENDEIIISVKSEKYGTQYATLTYNGEEWCFDDYLKYLEGENEEDGTLEVTALYAPCYEVLDDAISLKEGKTEGMDEYLEVKCHIENRGVLQIPFSQAKRNYSRIRIACASEVKSIFIAAGRFTPAGIEKEYSEVFYNETPFSVDENGNAYIYGSFGKNDQNQYGWIYVEDWDIEHIPLIDYYYFTKATEPGKSYALDARPVIDGTLGGKTEATEDDITALVEQLKEYVDNGITTIIVTGSEPTMIDMGNYTTTAIGEAIYCLSGSGAYDENNPYNGKIDLILSDVTEIGEWEFYYAFALNSITLPKVTTIGDMAFQGCDHLTKLTFGSVLTTIDEHDGLMFWVGEKVDGCDLFLNCGQMNSQHVPDLATNTWTILHSNEFNSITLTHTGENSECDECKALQ